jgi:type IV pilus assembly protein PilE|tara:strand:+ start:8348 stop:8767 length:420 start_codon:yes stop_codon:yes gene_type:complete
MSIHLLKKHKGFTLLELMIVTAIIGTLVSIAVPSYTAYIRESRETDGREDTYRIMAQQERYFLKNMAYSDNLGLGGLGYSGAANAAVTSPGGFFAMTASTCTGWAATDFSCIRVIATGQDQMAATNFWLESNGSQSPNL